nr:zinc finger protein weckle isoform X2 [Drosophila kikkawai]
MAEDSHWLSWCRLCAKDDARRNVKVQMSDQTGTWDNVLVMAIRKYFEVHVQAIFEVLRRTEKEPDKRLDVAALRQQYGLDEDDWTHIIKPMAVPEMDDVSEFGKRKLVLQEESQPQGAREELIMIRDADSSQRAQTKDTLEGDVPKQEFIDMDPILLENNYTNQLGMDDVLIEVPQHGESRMYITSTYSGSSEEEEEEEDVKPDLMAADPEFLPLTPNEISSLVSLAKPLTADNEVIADESGKRRRMSCERCGKVYKNRASYEKHREGECRRIERRVKVDKATTANTTCDLCNKTLSSATALKLHKEGMHNNVKPFICDSCGKQLKTITALNEHKLVHTDNRPFECSICKARFKNRSRLKAHNQIHAEPSFVCNICGKKLQTRRTWNMHKVVHSEERRLKCDVCGALFKRSKTLKTHLLSHTGLRPYVCNYCGKSFACNANCRSHKVKKHPVEMQQEDAAGHLPSRLSIPTLEELRVMTKKLPKSSE